MVQPRCCFRLFGAALIIAVLLSGCGKRESVADKAAREGRYLMVLSADPQTLDPQVATGIPEYQVSMALFEPLVAYDPVTCEPRAAAAERWDVSADGRVYTFHLRSNGHWSNGDPLTAEDFVYSLRRGLAPALAAEYAYFEHPIRNARAYNQGQLSDAAQVGVRAIDPLTLEITLENPTSYFLALLTSGIYMPVHRASVEKAGRFDDRSSPWAKPGILVGNGPFVIQTWQTNQRLVVTKNPQYRDAAAVRLNAIEFLPMESTDTADRSYRAGQVHVTDTLPLSRVPIYREEKRPDFVTHTYLGTSFFYLNVNRPPLTDPRVRRALSLAIDRKAMVERVARGGQVPAGSFTPPGVIGYQPPLVSIFDPAEARRLLAEAGFPNGTGFPAIEGIYPTSDTARVMLEAMQDMWRRELGISVRVTNLEWKVFLDSLSKHDYQIGFMSWIGDYIDPNAFLSVMRADSGNNRSGWANPTYDALLDRADHTMDKGARFQILAEAEKLLLAEQPLVPLWHASRNYFLHPTVKGFTPNLLDLHPYQTLWLEAGVK